MELPSSHSQMCPDPPQSTAPQQDHGPGRAGTGQERAGQDRTHTPRAPPAGTAVTDTLQDTGPLPRAAGTHRTQPTAAGAQSQPRARGDAHTRKAAFGYRDPGSRCFLGLAFSIPTWFSRTFPCSYCNRNWDYTPESWMSPTVSQGQDDLVFREENDLPDLPKK